MTYLLSIKNDILCSANNQIERSKGLLESSKNNLTQKQQEHIQARLESLTHTLSIGKNLEKIQRRTNRLKKTLYKVQNLIQKSTKLTPLDPISKSIDSPSSSNSIEYYFHKCKEKVLELNHRAYDTVSQITYDATNYLLPVLATSFSNYFPFQLLSGLSLGAIDLKEILGISTKENRIEKSIFLLYLLNFSNIIHIAAKQVGLKHALPIQSALESILLAGNTYLCMKALNKGVSQITNETKKETDKKIEKVASGVVLTTGALLGLMATGYEAKNLFNSILKLRDIDNSQLEHIASSYALSVISGQKKCNAVLINGVLPRNSLLASSIPALRDIYKFCDVRSYSVKSLRQFTNVLKKSANLFGGKIDNLVIVGHGNSAYMDVGEKLPLRAKRVDKRHSFIKLVERYTSSNAHLILSGCNTATKVKGSKSLTEIVANNLGKNRKVFGMTSYYNPYFGYYKEKDGKLIPHSYYPIDQNKKIHFKDNVAVYPTA